MTINKKKIIIFSMSYYPRFVGGAEVALKEITDRINVNEYEFHLVTLRYDSSFARYEKIGNVHVYRIGYTQRNPSFKDLRALPLRFNKVLYQFWAPCIGWWLHRKIKFQTVWAMMAHSSGVPANIFSFFSKVPLILTLQEGDPTNHIEKQMRIFGPLFTTVFERASYIQVISQFLKEWAVKMGARKENVEVIPNGVDLNVFTYKELINSPVYRVVTASRLVPKNGIDTLIDTLLFLPNVHLDIIGDGFQMNELQEYVQINKLEDRIVFHGYKTQSDMCDIMRRANIFCRPSRSEGLGNAIMEAMALGIPIITTDVGGISDFVIDIRKDKENGNGLFCIVDDSMSIAEAIVFARANTEICKMIQKRARGYIEQLQSWTSIAKRIERMFDSIS